ncbi:hypothetical protein XENORESO_001443 [Xenotaenia resolanae]|uniref:Transmembrane protein n=1 Tax=Xenotaenia resolanae TaxID=208358 RepID=A0ABV0WC82_9TELE
MVFGIFGSERSCYSASLKVVGQHCISSKAVTSLKHPGHNKGTIRHFWAVPRLSSMSSLECRYVSDTPAPLINPCRRRRKLSVHPLFLENSALSGLAETARGHSQSSIFLSPTFIFLFLHLVSSFKCPSRRIISFHLPLVSGKTERQEGKWRRDLNHRFQTSEFPLEKRENKEKGKCQIEHM